MDGARRQISDAVGEEAAPQFVGGAPREGGDERSSGVELLLPAPIGEAEGEDSRLARASGSDDLQLAIGSGDGVELGRRRALERQREAISHSRFHHGSNVPGGSVENPV